MRGEKALGPAERCAACKAGEVPRWHPDQLRHNAATRLVQQFGWDVARMALGHRQVRMTRVDAESVVAYLRSLQPTN